MNQHEIPNPPPITDGMTTGAFGTGAHDLIGTVVTTYEVPDSDRCETLLLYEDGRVILVSCDPGYNDDAARTRNPTRWEVVLCDATDTDAGRAIQLLERGHWL